VQLLDLQQARLPSLVAAVNVRCLEGVMPSALEVMPFDGRSL